jgi:hypothetical protein
MAFDSNAMHELASLSRDRYQRAGGGGAFKVYATAKAYHESRGINEMSPWRRLVYETTTRWRGDAASAVAGFKWDCHALTLDVVNGEIPF